MGWLKGLKVGMLINRSRSEETTEGERYRRDALRSELELPLGPLLAVPVLGPQRWEEVEAK